MSTVIEILIVSDRVAHYPLSIITVHRIGAEPYYSWVTKGTHWLKDVVMLPGRFANARIMSFGYESQWFGENAVKTGLSYVANDSLADLQGNRKVGYIVFKHNAIRCNSQY